MAIKDLKEKCVEQLEVMSKKRIKRILAGIGCILHCHIHVYIVIFFQELYDRLIVSIYQYIHTETDNNLLILLSITLVFSYLERLGEGEM